MAEATKLATDSGVVVQTARRKMVCTYLGSQHPIAKGEQYVSWLTGWGHAKTDRLCIPCARRLGFIRPEED
jgi:ribosome modulation factor